MNSEFTIAVHSLVYLAHKPERMASSEEIADNVATNPARIRKVMSCLKRGGYVDTREGSGGGYRLTLDPAVVTLADIYRADGAGLALFQAGARAIRRWIASSARICGK